MNTMKGLLLIAAITLWWFTACNYTVGECWYRDQGSETAGAGAGGVILPPSPTGGDVGDAPPSGPLDTKNPGPVCNKPTESSKESPTESSTGGSSGYTPEEQAAIDALQQADPQEVATRAAVVSYAAVECASRVESQVKDPDTVDAATVDQLIDQCAPMAWSDAQNWFMMTDPSVIPTSIYPDFECPKEPYACPFRTECPYDGKPVPCLITQCGTGQCPWCPWDLGNIIIKSWCAYGCMQGTKLVAGAYILNTRFWGPGERYCTY